MCVCIDIYQQTTTQADEEKSLLCGSHFLLGEEINIGRTQKCQSYNSFAPILQFWTVFSVYLLRLETLTTKIDIRANDKLMQ